MTASSEFYSLSCGSCGGCRNECSETKEGATQSTACQSIQNPWGPRTEEAGGIGLNERLLQFIREDTTWRLPQMERGSIGDHPTIPGMWKSSAGRGEVRVDGSRTVHGIHCRKLRQDIIPIVVYVINTCRSLSSERLRYSPPSHTNPIVTPSWRLAEFRVAHYLAYSAWALKSKHTDILHGLPEHRHTSYRRTLCIVLRLKLRLTRGSS